MKKLLLTIFFLASFSVQAGQVKVSGSSNLSANLQVTVNLLSEVQLEVTSPTLPNLAPNQLMTPAGTSYHNYTISITGVHTSSNSLYAVFSSKSSEDCILTDETRDIKTYPTLLFEVYGVKSGRTYSIDRLLRVEGEPCYVEFTGVVQ